MIEINFGASDYVMYAPGIPYKDNITKIPEEGALPRIGSEIKIPRDQTRKYTTWINLEENWAGGSFGILHYAAIVESQPETTLVQGLPAVSLVADRRKVSEHEEIMLLWIEARREWIAIYKNRWYEGEEGGHDELYLGPFALDDICSRKLLQAYGVHKDDFDINEVKSTPPEMLQEAAAQG